MNEKLNLVEILKDCPEGTKLYSTVYGDVEFDGIENRKEYPVRYVKSDCSFGSVTAQGLVLASFEGECTLFPSREQRNWGLFTAPDCKKGKFDPNTLKPFDKILVRDSDEFMWKCALYSHTIENEQCIYKYVTLAECGYKRCIPYNDDTKHLVNTTGEAPEYYRYWED